MSADVSQLSINRPRSRRKPGEPGRPPVFTEGDVIGPWTIMGNIPRKGWLCRCVCGTLRFMQPNEVWRRKSCFNCVKTYAQHTSTRPRPDYSVSLDPNRVRCETILKAVCRRFDLHPNAMVTPLRTHCVAHARQLAMLLTRELTTHSLPYIGRRFGGRDHTTVIYAIKAVQKRMLQDQEIEADVKALRERLAA